MSAHSSPIRSRFLSKPFWLASLLLLAVVVLGARTIGTARAATVAPPTTPKNLAATVVSATQIKLSWTASTSKVGVAGYNIYINGNKSSTTTQTSYSATSLQPKTRYKFNVSAYDAQGRTSALSTAVTATTLADTSPPSTPGNFTATNVVSTSLTLNWTASTDNVAVVNYRILRDGVFLANTSALQLGDSGLTAGTSYSYSITANDAAGNVSPAATLSVIPVLPAPSTLQAASVTATAVTLSWSPSATDPNLTGYHIWRGGNVIASTANTTYADTNLAPATTYAYSVAAYDNAGNLSASVSLNVTTPPTVPAAPTALQALSISPTEAGLTWAPPTGPVPAIAYTVYRNGTKVGSTSAYDTNFLDQGLTPGTAYTYTVTATSASGGESPGSNAFAVITGLPAVSLTSCTNVSSPGDYVLTGNLSANGSTCLNIQNTTNVTVDCQGNAIAPQSGTTPPSPLINVNNVQHFMLVNCTVSPGSQAYGLQITGSGPGFIENDTFSSGSIVNVASSNGLVVANNTFNNGLYQQNTTTGSYIGHNAVSCSGYNGAGLIISNNGAGTTIDTNNLNGNGGFTPPNTNYGFDDGILLNGENADQIVGNTVQNVWDTGIETGNLISNSLFANNTINGARVSGIGGWDWNSWLGNTVSGNTVSNADTMFNFFNQFGVSSGQSNLYFENNTFTGNTMTNPLSAALGSSSSNIDMDYSDNPQIPAGSVVAGNNVFTNNNFGKIQSAPELWPASMIVDGGGNICGPEQFNKEQQLVCH